MMILRGDVLCECATATPRISIANADPSANFFVFITLVTPTLAANCWIPQMPPPCPPPLRRGRERRVTFLTHCCKTPLPLPRVNGGGLGRGRLTAQQFRDHARHRRCCVAQIVQA